MQINILDIVEGKEYTINKSMVGDDCVFSERHIKFNQKIDLIGKYIYFDDTLNVDAEILTEITAECDRCLGECIIKLSIPFNETFRNGNEDTNFCIDNNKIELTNAVYQNILLNIPSNILCQESCKGICVKCGCNRNKKECKCMSQDAQSNSPFAILKNFVGGAKDGSTKK